MGNQCCGNDLRSYEKQIQQKIQQLPTALLHDKRIGQPTSKIAIKINKLYQAQGKNKKQINEMIFKFAEHEKKFKQPLRIPQNPIPNNRLADQYYIPSLNALYIGQWVYNNKLEDQVPGGIGRLFENGCISEGVFKTYREDQIHSLQNKLEQDNKLTQINKPLFLNNTNFVIKLNGNGRFHCYEQNSENYVYMKGLFADGILNGRGIINSITVEEQKQVNKIFGKSRKRSQRKKKKNANSTQNANSVFLSPNNSLVRPDKSAQSNQLVQQDLNQQNQIKIQKKTQYFFDGLWINGKKHGKGIQKVNYTYKAKSNQFNQQQIKATEKRNIQSQSFHYDGNFQNDEKTGKGSLTYLTTQKNQNNIKKDKQKMKNKMQNQGNTIQQQTKIKLTTRQNQQRYIQNMLDSLSKSKASDIKLIIQGALLFDLYFILQRTYRTIFNQNYTGDFKNNQMEGSGVYVWPNGKTYRGKWKNNFLNGQGIFYWPDGTYYQGQYQNDERFGRGIIIWNVKKRYRGSWAYGMRHGYGQSIQISQDQQTLIVKRAIWNQDKVQKHLPGQTLKIPDFKKIRHANLQQQKEIVDNNIFNKITNTFKKAV